MEKNCTVESCTCAVYVPYFSRMRSMQKSEKYFNLQIFHNTGSGKSLCYQALPLASDNGITLVVCPLLSIMKEQVSCMNAVRIKSTYIGKSPEEDNLIEEGAFSIVYGSAEEIIGKDRWRRVWRSETYSRLLAIVIDEAHTL